MPLDAPAVAEHSRAMWEQDILPTISDYIRIPNVSPAYDRDWLSLGHMDAAVSLLLAWARAREIDGLTVERLDVAGRTPLLLAEVPAFGTAEARLDRAPGGGTVLLYGHLDKQPPMNGWREGLGPWTPVVDGDLLYGRGGADDGYSLFAALAAIEAVQKCGGEHARCIVLIEASEESGSPDLPTHLDALGDRLAGTDLVVCLDSGCGTYDRLWVTTSLRGMAALTVRVDVLTEGVHSGGAGGVVPSSFRLVRRLLDHIEDPSTGELVLPGLKAEIPAERREQARLVAGEEPDAIAAAFPFVEGAQPQSEDPVEQILDRTWRASLEVIGASGIPECGTGGNVLRPYTTLQLSMRVPPTIDAMAAAAAVKDTLMAAPASGACVTVDIDGAESGWSAPPSASWLQQALTHASLATFGKQPRAMGEGGTIPFLTMLGHRFPDAQFVVTGVLGPKSNAHGPNEFLHLPAARNLTAAIAHVLDIHARSTQG